MKQFLLPLLLITALHAQPELRPQNGVLREYLAHRAASAITVDGDLRDPAWAKAEVASLAFPWPAQTGKHQVTSVRLLWDEHTLYFAFDCDDADITVRHKHRDDPTYEDDAAEIFLNPFPQRTEYVGMEINARAVLYDYLYVHPHKLHANYDLKGVRVAAQWREGARAGWTIEAAVPLINFVDRWDNAPVHEGTVWRMNLSRWDGTGDRRVFSIWSDSGKTRPDPHSPQRFGLLRFGR